MKSMNDRIATETTVFLRASLFVKRCVVAILLVIIIVGCSSDDDQPPRTEVPDHISQLENLTVYDPEIQPADTVILTRETIFESGEEIYMSGYISTFKVDDNGRVFVVSSIPGDLGVYIFNPDGSYLTTIGQSGRGPGEFESIRDIDVLGNELVVFDPILQKFAIYSLDNFEIIEEEIVNLTELIRSNKIPGGAKVSGLTFVEYDRIILQINKSSSSVRGKAGIYYHNVQRDGLVNPARLLKVDMYARYFLPEQEGWQLFSFVMSFNRSSLVSISENGHLFTAWTEDFLIKEYDANGRYLRSFYYPIGKSQLELDQINLSDHERRTLRDEEIPESWPALHTMELDDEGRLWVATITDSTTEFTWWVLNRNGEVIARFRMPGDRSTRFVRSKADIVIKNGYLYTHERDIRQGIDRVVKHKIEFIKR